MCSKNMATKFYPILQRLVNNKYKNPLLYRVKLHTEESCSAHYSTCGESPSLLQWDNGKTGGRGSLSAFFFQLTEPSLPMCPLYLIHISSALPFTSVLTQASKGSSIKLGTHKLLSIHLKTPGIVQN